MGRGRELVEVAPITALVEHTRARGRVVAAAERSVAAFDVGDARTNARLCLRLLAPRPAQLAPSSQLAPRAARRTHLIVQLRFNRLRNSYPHAVHAANAGDRVQSTLLGEVYSVNEQALESLDKLEEHPDYYRRELIQVDGESEPAWMYLIVDKDVLSNLDKYQVVDPPGDWRTHHVGKAVESWPATKRTATSAGPHAVFSYGSNGLEQLRERCQNEKIEGQPATLANAVRVFAGASARWDGGGVASIVPCPGLVVHGNIAHLSDGELKLLDGFERGFQGLSDDPYEADGVYRRQDLVAKLEATGELIEACAYVKCDLTWVKPPSAKYMNACRTNVDLFWPGRDIPIEIRDGVGRLREDE